VPISSTTNQIIAIFAALPLFSVAYLGLRSHKNRRLRWYYRGALLVEFVAAAVSGGRGNVISVILLALGVAYYSTRRFPLKAAAVCALIGLFAVFPILVIYRANSQASGYEIGNLSEGVSTYAAGGFESALLSGVSATFERFDDIIAPAVLEGRGRSFYPLPFGGTIGPDFANLVPHALAPSKPINDNLSNGIAYALRLSDVPNNYFAMTMQAETYLDFGTLGAVVAFMILGAFYRGLNDWFGARRQNAAVCGIYLGVAYFLIQTQETFIGDQLFGMVRELLVVAVLLKGAIYLLAPSGSRPSRAPAKAPQLTWTPD
jgi:oligosaccharide repeat unit polymerase